MAVDVGLMIKKKRKEKGISQQQLSKLSGISQSAISDIENPEVTKKPNTDTITKLANALGCGVSELLEESTIDEPKYSLVEKNLIDDFRSLSRPGKEYILQTMAMAVITYAEKNPPLSGMEEAE